MNDFSEALRLMRQGARVSREGWNGPNQYIFIVDGMKSDQYRLEPFIVIRTVQGKYIPWLASQGDLLAEDWTEV